jgi:hypothetical protein
MSRRFVLALAFLVFVSRTRLLAESFTTISPPGVNEPNGGSAANGINGGNIVGDYFTNTNEYGYLYNGSTFTQLNDPFAQNGTIATGVGGNLVVGYYLNSSGAFSFTYNISNQSYSTLSDPGVSGTTMALGTDGTNIVGSYQVNGPDFSVYNYGFLFSGSTYTMISDPNADTSYGTYAYGISGDNVVGYYYVNFSRFSTFL